jgi:hypothetical protein
MNSLLFFLVLPFWLHSHLESDDGIIVSNDAIACAFDHRVHPELCYHATNE